MKRASQCAQGFKYGSLVALINTHRLEKSLLGLEKLKLLLVCHRDMERREAADIRRRMYQLHPIRPLERHPVQETASR